MWKKEKKRKRKKKECERRRERERERKKEKKQKDANENRKKKVERGLEKDTVYMKGRERKMCNESESEWEKENGRESFYDNAGIKEGV